MHKCRQHGVITCSTLYKQKRKHYTISSSQVCVKQLLDTHYSASWPHAVHASIFIYSECAVLIMVFALCDMLRVHRSKVRAIQRTGAQIESASYPANRSAMSEIATA
eukprot:18536-Heterococcus_DN1.PRE.4